MYYPIPIRRKLIFESSKFSWCKSNYLHQLYIFPVYAAHSIFQRKQVNVKIGKNNMEK